MVTLAAGPARAGGAKAIEEHLTCQCGCGLTIRNCNHPQCSFAVPVKQDIMKSLAAGRSAEEIMGRYVAEYGEKILSAPTHKGFNLVAWYLPYVVVLLGAGGILLVIRRWSRRVGPQGALEGLGQQAPTKRQRKRLDRELRKFEA